MQEASDSGYYDEQYYDPDRLNPRKSNYERYENERLYYIPLAAYFAITFLMKRLLSGQSSVVIDVGCAKGFLVQAFDYIPGITACGVDFSDYATRNSPKKIHDKVIRADARELPFQANTADLIVCLDMLEHLDAAGIDLAIQEAYRVLKPGSTYIVLIDIGEHGDADQDASHITIQDAEWWDRKFREHGFLHDHPLLPSLALKFARPAFDGYKTHVKPRHANVASVMRRIRPCVASAITLMRPGLMVFHKPSE